MTTKDARDEFVKCVFNLPNNLRLVDCIEKEQKRIMKRKYIDHVMSLPLDEQLCKPRTDFQLWNDWLDVQAKLLLRQKAFCINADTRAGKTEFVKMSLPGITYICTCAKDADEPDLREYEGPPFHHNILFDEATPRLVINKKDLFQAPRHDIDMGTSSTNCYAYKVHVWRVKMVICTNKWHDQVKELCEADQQWLAKNVVVLDVQGSMFSDQPLQGAPGAQS